MKVSNPLVICLFSVVSFASGLSLRAEPLEVQVESVEELTNALNVASVRTDKDLMTITLKAGVYDLSAIEPMSANGLLSVTSVRDTNLKLTIQGDPDARREEIVIDAGGKGRALYVDYFTNASVLFQHFTIRNGFSTGSGAALRVAGWAYFTYRDCAFICNRGNGASAVVYPFQGNWHKFYDCLFESNLTEGNAGSGGVIYPSHANDLVSGCRFVANTNWCDSCNGGVIRSSCMITNSAFVGNVFGNKAGTLGRWGYAGAVYANGGLIVDSVFTNNYAGSSTGGGAIALYGVADIVNCDFYGNYTDKQAYNGSAILCATTNSGMTNAVISGCTFTANRATGFSASGAVASFQGLITNCTFLANQSYYGGAVYNCSNVVDCVFAGNHSSGDSGSYGGGAAYRSVIYDSVITNNSATYQVGGAFDCRLYRCVIGNNYATGSRTQRTQEGTSTYYEDCEMIGGSPFGVCFNNCGFNRCHLHDYSLTNATHGTGYGYFISGKIAITNCLFRNIYTGRFTSGYAWNYDNTVINSTLIDCTYDWLSTDSSGEGTLSMTFVNNLFQGIKTRTWAHDDDVGQVFAGMIFKNNFMSTTLKIPGEGNLNCKTDPLLKAKLMGDRDPERPYGPRHNSVLVGAGVVQDWMSEATDFDGHPRLSGGKVAIGAFESIEPVPGAILILR